MNEFDPIIQATRERFEPSREDRDRVRQRLLERAAGVAIAGSLVAKGSAGATKGVSLLAGHSLGGLAKLLFGSMAVTFVGAGTLVAATRFYSAPPVSSTKPATSAAAEPTPALNPGPALPHESAAAAPSAISVPAAAASVRQAQDTARRPSASGLASAPSPDLDAELALLREVRAASASGEHARAEQLLGELDRTHPRGLLLEERSALRAMTACDAGDTTQARALGDEFLRLHPTSVYAAKVRRACRVATQGAPVPRGAASASFTDPGVSGH